MSNKSEPQFEPRFEQYQQAGSSAGMIRRAHSTPDPDSVPPAEPTPTPIPEDDPLPTHAPVEEPRQPEPPMRAA